MMRVSRRQGGIVREEAAEILALHNGDALEALRTLIAERDAVEEQLAVATLVMRRQYEAEGRP
ncbi:hypothetical protein KYK30_13955 [Shinella yambaruensis]|uniref:ANTAR domain-containing protein n=1 Tax=Shinella yambaruensis TaxID=415996 RepID=A0ABQ5ZC90_9HYPH|nr:MULTISPECIES: hypothetical protein [Shinella]CAI0337138.1 conserved hypothetical protein [Rhizobiaceae bacterium]CAK7255653.1 ANTAR domain-containing protein [Shinella sp. WSC3-e]MCJ8024358.1 hypothetical protein [Shinella yambaruensis]MCO5135921.1 hypothetical protein [Shinella sp.]MCU7980800.1 hypothetical protein [Shinella yambaruensis]